MAGTAARCSPGSSPQNVYPSVVISYALVHKGCHGLSTTTAVCAEVNPTLRMASYRCAYYWRPTQAACLLVAKERWVCYFFFYCRWSLNRCCWWQTTKITSVQVYIHTSYIRHSLSHRSTLGGWRIISWWASPHLARRVPTQRGSYPKRTHAQLRRANRRAGTWTAGHIIINCRRLRIP